MTPEGLKPCPFCGCTRLKVVRRSEKIFPGRSEQIFCEKCKTRGPGMGSEEAAIAAWNDRDTAKPAGEATAPGFNLHPCPACHHVGVRMRYVFTSCYAYCAKCGRCGPAAHNDAAAMEKWNVMCRPVEPTKEGAKTETEDENYSEPLPKWAIRRTHHYSEPGAQLQTRDGRKCGNAVVESWHTASNQLVVKIVTDMGNSLELTMAEVASMFYPPEFVVDLKEHANKRGERSTPTIPAGSLFYVPKDELEQGITPDSLREKAEKLTAAVAEKRESEIRNAIFSLIGYCERYRNALTADNPERAVVANDLAAIRCLLGS